MHVPLTEVILCHDGTELARATLPPGEYIIGREPGVDLRADTPLLSRQHARLTINYDHLLLEDLASSNGTFVNDRPLAEPTRLFPNQRIRLGPDITLEVRRQRAPTEPGVSLAPAQAAIARHLPAELLAEKRYAIGGVIAQGGMGAILDARQRAIDRTVAMKVMLATGDEADVLRFIDEAKITGQLDHPNIVPIHELGVDEQGQLFYTMKMVRGITLKKVLADLAASDAATEKKYPLPVLLTVFQKVCDALAFAHAKGVIHRDLKPENLMLGDFGSVLVMDWGLAKVLGQKDVPGVDVTRSGVVSARSSEPEVSATMAGSIMGTPAYMSPEQARGEIETLDARSDIYALGAILFEILHLRPAVTGRAAMEIVDKVTRGEVEWDSGRVGVPPAERRILRRDLSSSESASRRDAGTGGRDAHPTRKIPDSLAAVVRKAMAFDQAARYRRVEDLQADLLAYQNGFATAAEKAGAWKQMTLFVRRHKIASGATGLILLLVFGFTAKLLTDRGKIIAERNRAEKALTDLKKQAPGLRQFADSERDFQRFDSALEKLDGAIALEPEYLPAYWRRAWLLIGMERFADATSAIRLAREKDSANAKRADILPIVEQIAAASSDAERWNPERAAAILTHLRAVEASREIGALSAKFQLGANEKVMLVRNRLEEWLGKNIPLVDADAAGLVCADLCNKNVETLEPLRGLPIEILKACGKLVSLEPLRGMRLREFWAGRYGTGATPLLEDLSPLAGMPLTRLFINGTRVQDLSPLKGMPLTKVNADQTQVIDLSPLRESPLRFLSIVDSKVGDLSPLRGTPIEELHIHLIRRFKDLTPLLDLPKLEKLRVSKLGKLLEPLRHHPTLQFLAYDDEPYRPATEFWATYDAEK